MRTGRTRTGALSVSFILHADLDRLRIPARRRARFADGLWRSTCFEVFVARKGSRAYREYNLSPSGEWASYAFASYRKRIDTGRAMPRIRIRRNGILKIEARVDAPGPSRIGLAAVIEEKGGALSYWALRHAPGRPDFHRRRAFAMALG